MKKIHHLVLWPALAVILLDQITKAVVMDRLRAHASSVPVIRGFFNLVHVRNRGMAFGLMNSPHGDLSFYILLFASLGAVVFILVWTFKFKEKGNLVPLGLGLILGGAVGNLIDRLRFHEVIDFLDFHLGAYHWPAFNVADSAITVGTFMVAIGLMFLNKRRD